MYRPWVPFPFFGSCDVSLAPQTQVPSRGLNKFARGCMNFDQGSRPRSTCLFSCSNGGMIECFSIRFFHAFVGVFCIMDETNKLRKGVFFLEINKIGKNIF